MSGKRVDFLALPFVLRDGEVEGFRLLVACAAIFPAVVFVSGKYQRFDAETAAC